MPGSKVLVTSMKTLDYILYLVTDRNLARSRSIEEIVTEAVRGGVTVVQLREKDLSTEDFLRQAFSLKELTDRMGHIFQSCFCLKAIKSMAW